VSVSVSVKECRALLPLMNGSEAQAMLQDPTLPTLLQRLTFK